MNNQTLQEITYIGPYIANRFNTHSVWNGQNVPVDNLQQLKEFIVRRANNVNENQAKKKISEWLKNVTTNQRSQQCLENENYIRDIDGVERRYKIRKFNFFAYNAIIDFWNQVIPNDMLYQNKRIKMKIPRKIPQLSIRHKYPVACATI